MNEQWFSLMLLFFMSNCVLSPFTIHHLKNTLLILIFKFVIPKWDLAGVWTAWKITVSTREEEMNWLFLGIQLQLFPSLALGQNFKLQVLFLQTLHLSLFQCISFNDILFWIIKKASKKEKINLWRYHANQPVISMLEVESKTSHNLCVDHFHLNKRGV